VVLITDLLTTLQTEIWCVMKKIQSSSTFVMRHFGHPWDGRCGWVHEQYESPDHESALYGAEAMMAQGWHVWIISNIEQPGFVVYREQSATPLSAVGGKS